MNDTGQAPGLPTAKEIDGSFIFLQDAFRAQREFILERAGGGEAYTDKDDGSPVTRTDIEVQEQVLAAMKRECPNVPVFGEENEGYDSHNLPPVCWLIDPIDGTRNFLSGTPGITCTGALVEKGVATACFIYDVAANVMYTAQLGQGALKDGNRLDLAAMPLPKTALCKDQFVEQIDNWLKGAGVHCQNPQTGGSYGFTRVADGQVAARFNLHGGGYPHDYAPGALLVSEAHGSILTYDGQPYDFRTRAFVACHPALVPAIEPHLTELNRLEAARPPKRGA